MMRLLLRVGVLFTFVLLLVLSGVVNRPVGAHATNDEKKLDDTTNSAPNSTTDVPASEASSAPVAAQPPAQGSGKGSGRSMSDAPAPRVVPMLATTGTIGLFTVETADTLPEHGFGFTASGNKFGRMPGSLTVFQLGLDFSYGLTDRLNVYGGIDTYGHTHLGNPSQLSLATPNNAFPLFPNTIYHTLPGVGTPGYVEDYPFAGHNGGGIGDVTLGLKFALLSERLGNPVSLSVRNDVVIATRNNLAALLANGTQSSALSDMISLALSKKWGNAITATLNTGYLFTRSPRSSDEIVMRMANQFKSGAGFIFLPESRIQPMMEYTVTVFSGGNATPDTTFGARDPIDGVWGVRIYPWRNIALDLGYRYMLNLKNAHDRHGFVVKLNAGYWPEKPAPQNRTPTATCSADRSMVYLGAGEPTAVTVTASDPDNDPLTYSWSSTGGQVDGTGTQVRWLSGSAPLGTYSITAHVDDGRGGITTCSADVQVENRPNRPPTITCSPDRPSVFAGERVHITCNGSDPDSDTLAYTWRANAGQVAGNGAAGDFDTTGLAPGTYSVTTRVDDSHGGAAEATTPVDVKAVPPPPQASKINECIFGRPLSARVDNVCKRILDDVALRLQNEPKATAVIIGYSEPRERRGAKIAGDRSTNAIKYLGEKGIDASRVTSRTGAGQAGATNNRRIDVIYVPEGATY